MKNGRTHALCLAVLAVLALLPVAAELFSTTTVLSQGGADVTLHFLYSRAFGFGEMARGNLPLWNPYIYSGIPYLGQFQSALLYPLNLIFLVLPLATAINWSFGLHIFVLGAATYAWAARRGLRPAAAVFAGCVAMFNGTFFLHIFAGHLSNVCTMAWAPVVFLGIDGWLARRHAGWIFLSAGAVALQVYAGHPQYVYYTALLAGLYSLIFLVGSREWTVAALGLLAIYPLGALLSAAQLIPGITATSEAVRSGGVNYEFASMFSFPPENLLTLVAPWFYGNMQSVPYWGRCYLWEMSFFIGAGALLLAIHGALQRGASPRLLILLVAAIVLALGIHTPLHHLLYQALPGFSAFRGSSKFIFFAGLFAALLAGMGADRLLRGSLPSWKLGAAGLAAGVLFLVASLGFSQDGAGKFRHLAELALQTQESYLNPQALQMQDFLGRIQTAGIQSLQIAGVSFLLFGGLLFAIPRWKPAGAILIGAAVLELFLFARASVVTFPLAEYTYQPLADFLKQNPGDYRTLNMFNADAAMYLRAENIWGYDPGVLKRYAQLLYASQGLDPKDASQYLPLKRPHPILALLRGRFAFLPSEKGITSAPISDKPFPRFFIVSDYEVVPDPNARLDALESASLDFGHKVLLEKEPIPAPEKEGGKYQIRIVKSSTDEWIINVMMEKAGILVMTDSYAKDWQAIAQPGSVQQTYNLMAADHALRAIPLAAGTHDIKIRYVPSGFHLGVLATLISLGGLIGCLAWRPLRRRLDFAGLKTEHLRPGARKGARPA